MCCSARLVFIHTTPWLIQQYCILHETISKLLSNHYNYYLFNILRCPAVRTGLGRVPSEHLASIHCPEASTQWTLISYLSNSFWQNTQGTAHPKLPSERYRSTKICVPYFRRIQATILWDGTPCFRACCTQESSSRLSAQHLCVLAHPDSHTSFISEFASLNPLVAFPIVLSGAVKVGHARWADWKGIHCFLELHGGSRFCTFHNSKG